MDSVEREHILELEESFQEKNFTIVSFFYKMIANEAKPEIKELYQYCLDEYSRSIEYVAERVKETMSDFDKYKLFLERDLYINYVMKSNGIMPQSYEDKKKTVK